ncbi:unnamed protein product [Polarella glacialis]|uniref:Uncharacterized protein n=1 Tax=Polarella glacialis TaxID=89957 RepID=A0A813HM31_POLGL|nr:unnamed protein product [Polarella glacialis]
MPPFSPMGLRSPSKRRAMHRSSTQVEQVETMLDNLLDGPDPLDSKLNKLNFQKAKRKMLDALAEKDEITDGHEEELEDILMYKGRPVTACLLHFAVWCSARLHDSACVEAVLPYLTADDIFAKARYQSRHLSYDETWLDASLDFQSQTQFISRQGLDVWLHLTSSSSTSFRKLLGFSEHSRCLVHRVDSSGEHTGDEPDYTPLCESTYSGNKDVSMWLLDHQADAQMTNKEGVSPLHFVSALVQLGSLGRSMRGITGGLEADDALSKLVGCLCKAGASLTSRIPDSHYDARLRGKIPLELLGRNF